MMLHLNQVSIAELMQFLNSRPRFLILFSENHIITFTQMFTRVDMIITFFTKNIHNSLYL